MTPHKPAHSDKYCLQESRITRLEERSIQSENKENDLEDTLNKLNDTLTQLCELNARTQAIINTLKWVITITVMIFGAIFVFLITELIRMIPPL